jgi:gamma-glutamylcyclotransferase (GGCT)/AIG2-like uncharacterized protein YtfP
MDESGTSISPDHVLIAYGSLRPGEKNHNVVHHINGYWISGIVHGELGRWMEYPQFIPNSETPGPIEVQVLISNQLPENWQKIDKFEGNAYMRVLLPVETADGTIIGNIYVRRLEADIEAEQ